MTWKASCCVIMILVNVELTLTKDCLRPAEEEERIPFFNGRSNTPRLASGVQAIITSYQFHCCGNVTAWQTYVEHRQCSRIGAYGFTFQVWRPSPTVNTDGCYGLVGENRFPSITLGDQGLVSETPEPTNIITVQPRDVVGFFVISHRANTNDGIYLDSNFNEESVWYHRNTVDDPLVGIADPAICPHPVGSQTNRVLMSSTNAAPILSVDISSFSCPPPSSTLSLSSLPLMQRTSSPPPLLPRPSPTPVPTSTPQQTLTKSLNTVETTTPVPTSTPRLTLTESPSVSQPSKPQPVINITANITSMLDGGLNQGVIGGIAGVGGVIFLFILIVMLITIIRRKSKKLRTFPNSPVMNGGEDTFSMKIQENETHISTHGTTNEAIVPIPPFQTYDLVNEENYATINEDVKMQKNDAYVTTSHIPVTTNVSYATNIVLNPNQAYTSINTEEQSIAEEDSYDYI